MKLRIAADGTVRGLWSNVLDWPAIGRVQARRESHVEFRDCRQRWYVRAGRPRRWIRRMLQWVLQRPYGEILYWARTRNEALAWEQRHFGPGGSGWTA